MKRRAFLGALGASATISALDWLRFFGRNGIPGTPRELGIAKAAAAVVEPRFLIYWFLEGGWDGYSMFNPVATRNDALGGSSVAPEQQIYRPNVPLVGGLYPVKRQGNIRYGHLATGGTSLFGDMAVVSSHHGGTFHSGSRLNYHMGKYQFSTSAMRAPNERSVMQAFAEVYGASFLISNVSWHNWLSDGELSPANYPEGTGYYEKLGPPYAHTTYGNTPELMRQRLALISASAGSGRDTEIHKFVDGLHTNFMKDKNSAAVKAFASAVELNRSYVTRLGTLDTSKLFTDPTLRSELGVTAEDEKTTSKSVNGNPARSKNTPNTNVQALMAYELMTKGLSNAFWIESRDVRTFDSHRNRAFVLENKGQYDQQAQMDRELWKPLTALVKRLKNTQHKESGKTFWDLTTIVLASEMGRSLGGGDDDVCQHWDTSSVVFLGGKVRGGTQFGGVGTTSLDAIPIMPDGTMDLSYDPQNGTLRPGATKNTLSFVPGAGHVFATALELTGISKAAQTGLNESPAMSFIKK
jgi:hypothetical protein